ncbi:hypothetical protein Poli38472_004854 [Pythium oligandrum]|uniref:Uncharacterized protein n=1 Tax=Pythium oligandrum TaxID=41045 RepID=A0A8K1CAZ5_PYTOL|nr:hypothetical protein Poli38472_004854 [Pythium oligandrum]|eukprot:TMW59785.1 hypothetical protein Poli38472_004854 [Pythium oligandrum]
MEALFPLPELVATDEIESTDLLWEDIRRLEMSQDASESGNSTPPEEDHVGSRAKARRKYTAIPTETRRKMEMAHLKEQMNALMAELVRLRRVDEAVIDPLSHVDNDKVSVWERIAKRQQRSKRRAEVENMKLRIAVASQLHLIQSLEKLLTKRPSEVVSMEARYSERKRRRIACTDDEVTAKCEHFRPRLVERVTRVDQAMGECGLHAKWTEGYEMETKLDAEGTLYMDVCIIKLFPFPVNQTADAVWKCISTSRLEFQHGVYGASTLADTSDSDWCHFHTILNLRSQELTSVLHVNGFSMRVNEAERVVIVSDSEGNTDGDMFDGHSLYLRRYGYLTIEQVPMPNEQEKSLTIVKSFVRMWPDLLSRSSDEHQALVERFLNNVVASFMDTVKTMIQFVEDSLIEMSIQQ